MAELVGDKTFDTRLSAPTYAVAEEKLVALLKQAGLTADRMRCQVRRVTEKEFEFHFEGRVKPVAQA